MSKRKKGLSLDEKRKVILSIYHESLTPFNLKEIEQLASKRGVVQQSVKEVNQSLVDDGFVCCDKIGSSNFFWSFPLKGYVEKLNLLKALDEHKHNLSVCLEEKLARIEQEQRVRTNPQRAQKLAKLQALEEEEAQLDEKINVGKENDPAELAAMTAAALRCKASAERWTDNVFAVKQYMVKKRGINSKEANKYLGIDENFDYSVYQG